MDENELKDLLNKIGKRIFVRYFQEFGDLGIPSQDLVILLQREESFKSQATATRVTNARRIFHDGLEEKALSIISESVRVERKVADEASALLTQLRSRPNRIA